MQEKPKRRSFCERLSDFCATLASCCCACFSPKRSEYSDANETEIDGKNTGLIRSTSWFGFQTSCLCPHCGHPCCVIRETEDHQVIVQWGDINDYLSKLMQYRVDPKDKEFVASVYEDFNICVNCFRPVQEADFLDAWQVTAEIVSYYVYLMIFMPFLSLVYAVLALFESIRNRRMRKKVSKFAHMFVFPESSQKLVHVNSNINKQRVMAERKLAKLHSQRNS